MFVSFVLLTYPECFSHADCSNGKCTEKGLCKCAIGQVKEGTTCKRGKSTDIVLPKDTVKLCRGLFTMYTEKPVRQRLCNWQEK